MSAEPQSAPSTASQANHALPAPPVKVEIDEPASMNLLGLILANILERRIAAPDLQKRVRRLRGAVVVDTGRMVVTLHFADGTIRLTRGPVSKPRAKVSGSMDTLIQIALGGGMIKPWLARRLKTKGSRLTLIRLIPLLRTH